MLNLVFEGKNLKLAGEAELCKKIIKNASSLWSFLVIAQTAVTKKELSEKNK